MVLATGAELEAKGVILALADGVSGNGGGREAAEYTVRGLLSDYYATPETWGTALSLDRVLNAINRWLIAQAAAHREFAGMATTLSALVLRGTRCTIAHIGDSRIYRLRDGKLARLTTDHVWDREDMRHVLTRAIGLDAHLAMDYAEEDLAAGDVFLLVSDGALDTAAQSRRHHVGTANGPRLLPLQAADELKRNTPGIPHILTTFINDCILLTGLSRHY